MSNPSSVMACSVRGRTRRCRGASSSCLLALLFAIACGRSDQGRFVSVARAVATAIAFVQTNDATPQTPVISVSVPYTLAQSAGDLNVVVVGWNDTMAQVASVTDTKGNAYQLAVSASSSTPGSTRSARWT